MRSPMTSPMRSALVEAAARAHSVFLAASVELRGDGHGKREGQSYLTESPLASNSSGLYRQRAR